MKTKDGLPTTREKFAQLVAGGMTQTDAYIKAFPTSKKWNNLSVRTAASKMASDPRVRKRIEDLIAAQANRAGLKAEEIIEEIRRIALSDPAGIIDSKTGKFKLPHEMDAATRASLMSFEIDDLGRVKYKFWPKVQALEQAVRILGLNEKDNRQRNPLADLLDSLPGNVFGPTDAGAQPGEDEEDE